ncbi:MAG: hypothetical protein ACYC8T_25945 [Myxococcaceae bacterium]
MLPAALTGLHFRAFAFTGAFLMFVAELMVARALLPSFGSSAAVWTTCLMFYQAVLFLGYLYAGFIAARAGLGRWRLAHALMLLAPLATFPFHFVKLPLPPIAAVLLALCASVGPAFFALSTTSIVAQRWFSLSAHPHRADPHFLYGVSNAGSLIALLSYPLLIERTMGMRVQLFVWYGLYAAFVLLHLFSLPRGAPAKAPELPPHALPARAERLYWLLLAGGGTALLTAVTNVVTLDASAPLLWMLPLTLYLVTLVISFARKLPSFRTVGLLCGASLLLALPMVPLGRFEPRLLQASMVTLHCAVLFAGCLLVHWNLARARPAAPELLGAYYLRVSLGGGLGTAFVVLVLPLAFGWLAVAYLDYVLAGAVLLGALVLRDRAKLRALLARRPFALAGVGVLAAGILVVLVLAAREAVRARVDGARTFYGLYQVKDEKGLRFFRHGNTVHGLESNDPERAGEPLAYFHHGSPIGRLLDAGLAGPRVAVVGLGVGSLAAYARDGDEWDFYELDEEVERIARAHFGFLSRARGRVRVLPGDARLTLESAPDGGYGLLVVDAFSSDFVPTHLITREAVELYLAKCTPGARLAFHVSSRSFDFLPELARIAAALGLQAVWSGGIESSPAELAQGRFGSLWVVMGRDSAAMKPLEALGFQAAPAQPGEGAWTDDRIDLLRALRR